MKKTKTSIFAAATALTVLLSGCSGVNSGSNNEDPNSGTTNSASGKQDEITLYTIQSTNPNFEAWLNEAQEKSGVKINWVAAPTDSDTRQQKISTILSSGDSSVDILEINDEMATSFKNAGWLDPLQDSVLTSDIVEQFPQGYMEDMLTSDKGDIIGVPSYSGYLGLWVDQKKLDAAGMKSIETEEDFVNFMKASTKDGQYGYGGSWEKTYVFNEIATFVNLFGGDYFDWTNEGSRKAIKFMYDMANTWKVTPVDQIADKYEQMNQKFIDGKYAMVFMWGTGNDYKEANRYGMDQIHMINMPRFAKRSIFTDSWSYVLNSSSKNKEAAIKFLKYAAGEEGELSGWKNFGRYPARADVASHEAVSGDVKVIYTEIQATNEIHGRPMLPQTMEFISEMGTLFQNYIQDQMTLDEFCTKAQEAVEKYK
ncbi:extracellular solute-binding protein [Paenibacillus sp. N4]|uniref:sugar ABC transporter substrate-binding protein n=1 Tax=Paenibacillus vietnamensis TaxID=2590547 RepID=UPI001CD0C2E0|nr:extracellular solute-binding protein [Paenibacillus vietnamensis]MCA0754968.1 extracellular solute-binding protein [Paenibacillus vietnamensis]